MKSSSGPRYVVGCRAKVDRAKLTPNTRVALDVTTLTIMRILPREVDPVVFNMTQVAPAAGCGAAVCSSVQRSAVQSAKAVVAAGGCPTAAAAPDAAAAAWAALDVAAAALGAAAPAPLPQEDPGKVDYSNIGGLSEQIRCGLAAAGGGGSRASTGQQPLLAGAGRRRGLSSLGSRRPC